MGTARHHSESPEYMDVEGFEGFFYERAERRIVEFESLLSDAVSVASHKSFSDRISVVSEAVSAVTAEWMVLDDEETRRVIKSNPCFRPAGDSSAPRQPVASPQLLPPPSVCSSLPSFSSSSSNFLRCSHGVVARTRNQAAIQRFLQSPQARLNPLSACFVPI